MPELDGKTDAHNNIGAGNQKLPINQSLGVPRLFGLYPLLAQKYIITMGFRAFLRPIMLLWLKLQFSYTEIVNDTPVFSIKFPGSDWAACNINDGQLKGGWLKRYCVIKESVTCTTSNYKSRQTCLCHQSFCENAFNWIQCINGQTAKWSKPVDFTRGRRRQLGWDEVTPRRFLLVPWWLVCKLTFDM